MRNHAPNMTKKRGSRVISCISRLGLLQTQELCITLVKLNTIKCLIKNALIYCFIKPEPERVSVTEITNALQKL